MQKKDLQAMLEHAVHFGHRTTRWNPKMAKYIFDSRKGVHIFDLNKTALELSKALDAVTEMSKEGKKILFVGTKQHVTELVKETAQKTKMPYVVTRWIPGLLTNFSTVKKRIKYFVDLKDKEENGEFEKYTKQEVNQMKKEMVKLEETLGGVSELKKAPDMLFVLSVKRDMIAIKEAHRLKIPVIGICDTDADPELIDYPIPGNDDAIRSVSYFLGQIADAITGAKK